jgi:uncharacterized protein YnzC (UPF0291/DUF896 family)
MMMANSQAAILERIIEPEGNGLTPELARHILTLDFKPFDHDRMAELSAKAQEGALTQDEQEELNNYVHLSHFLALLQSKARLSLKWAREAG